MEKTLKQQAEEIRDEKQLSRNTATRVGGVLTQLVDRIDTTVGDQAYAIVTIDGKSSGVLISQHKETRLNASGKRNILVALPTEYAARLLVYDPAGMEVSELFEPVRAPENLSAYLYTSRIDLKGNIILKLK